MNNWKDIAIPPSTTIIEAMKIIDRRGSQFVVIVSEDNTLLGSLTDGDIRRGILKDIPLTEKVLQVMNKNPLKLPQGTSRKKAFDFMNERLITHIPIVDGEKILDIFSLIEDKLNPVLLNTAVLMVGGLGSRLGQLTSNTPKPMLNVAGQPVLEMIVENLRDHGFRDFVFCVNYRSEIIEAHFGDGKKLGVSIRYVHEPKKMGTAGALTLLPPGCVGPLLVMNGDIVTKVNFSKLLDFHQQSKVAATVGVRKYDFQVPYGVLKTDKGKITGIVEKPQQSFIVSAGINIIDTKCLSLIPQSEFFDMPQLLEKLITNDLSVEAFPIHEYWLDIGRSEDLIQVRADLEEK